MQAIILIAISTLIITAAFVGLVSLAGGGVEDVGMRFPWYVLAMGVAFVASVVFLTHQEADAETVLLASTGIGIITLVVTLLSFEGVMYAQTAPEEVFRSNLLVYLMTAGLIATGLTFWLVKYWRTFTRHQGSGF